ncbi:MAG: AAA family ATPase [Thermodesulfobacteriota bacterium]
MTIKKENIPDPKKIEKEIGEFLQQKYGDNVKLITPVVVPDPDREDGDGPKARPVSERINFDLKPEELVAYLDQFIIKQDKAKKILATKICTHFNRIRNQHRWSGTGKIVGAIKNNVLMMGPTGVGKTYMIRLIAQKIGVPFVKGDATKFSETGYVGGDVEDLVRDLVREAGNDIELAQHGIIYIDEIDKIASSRNLIGPDVSRTGVQRALLTLMEETEVEMKVAHDPVSIMQEVEAFRKTGKREKRVVNTKNILFIMSGSFGGLQEIINKRLSRQAIGFSAKLADAAEDPYAAVQHVRSEDLTEFGFETEFVGRLPVRAIFENLTEKDLLDILKNPSNPVVLNKRMDFAAYDIDILFDDNAMRLLAQHACEEKTGARGLVNAVEKALLPFENRLPSKRIRYLPVTEAVVASPDQELARVLEADPQELKNRYESIRRQEKEALAIHIRDKCCAQAERHRFPLTPGRIDIIAEFYLNNITDIENAFDAVRAYFDEAGRIEDYFQNRLDLAIILTDDAIEYIVRQHVQGAFAGFEQVCEKMTADFRDGFRLLADKAGQDVITVNQQALMFPESWLNAAIKKAFGVHNSGSGPQPE